MKLRLRLTASLLLTALLAFVALPLLFLPASNFTIAAMQTNNRYQYPFQNPDLPVEERITNILSLMTVDEKIECLGTNPSVPRLGIKGAGHMEGIHGLAVGGPAKWGRDAPVPTTTFPQGYGLGETWDTEVLREAAAVAGFGAGDMFRAAKYTQ